MKKIKKKKIAAQVLPTFLIGWTHGDPPPPGYLTAWFDQLYGGPLCIRFLSAKGHQHFEAAHTNWKSQVHLAPSDEVIEQWQGRLEWEHRHLAQILVPHKVPADRQNEVLHAARIARGLTLLSDGTTYDVALGVYRNPSDWKDHDLVILQIHDHVQVEYHEQMQHMRTWVHTRGLAKFGLDEIETFLPLGLPVKESEALLYDLAWRLVELAKNYKVGEQFTLNAGGCKIEIVRHRTDPYYGLPLAFREIQIV